MKDMLLTYNEYNTTLGYVQGMSDLLAPIYAVMQDDAAAFWAFVGFMNRTERNFLRDQSGMRAQLVALDHLVQLMDPRLYLHLQSADSTNFFFFFRMLLVWFKREFKWEDVLRLWEVLWTNYYSSQYHLFIALAILEKHRVIIIDRELSISLPSSDTRLTGYVCFIDLKQFDEVLKYINELSQTIDLSSTRIRAEALFKRFQRTLETSDKKRTAPSGLGRPGELTNRRRSSRGGGSQVDGEASTTGAESGVNRKGKGVDLPEAAEISEDLRMLLKRDVIRPT